MSNSGEREEARAGRKAWKACFKHFGTLVFVVLVHLIARAAVIAPLVLFGAVKGSRTADWAGVVLAAALYVALVVPLRNWSGEKMRRMFFTRNMPPRGRIIPYKKWLATGLLRHLRGFLWGIPFLACIGYLVVGYTTLPFNTMWQPIQMLAALAGQVPNTKTGALVALILVALFGALFAYGWWRDVAVEYMPIRSLTPVKAIHWARRIRREHTAVLIKNTLVNMLLTLPALVGFGAALVPYIKQNVDFSLSEQALAASIYRLVTLKTTPTQETLVILLLVFLVVYLPLLVVRKMRNAAVVAQYIKGRRRREHSEDDDPTGAFR